MTIDMQKYITRQEEKKKHISPRSKVTEELYFTMQILQASVALAKTSLAPEIECLSMNCLSSLFEDIIKNRIQPLIELSEEQDRTAVYNARKL